jgi:signal transduction histidine kinase
MTDTSATPRNIKDQFLAVSLINQFLFALGGVLAVSMVALTIWVNSLATIRILDATVGTHAFYLQSLLQPHVQSLARESDLSAAETKAIRGLRDDFSEHGNFMTVKIWRTDGTLAFAEDQEQMNLEHSSEEVKDALAGKVMGRLSDLDQDEHAKERMLGQRLYEIYAPLYDLETGNIIAIGEFYQNADYVGQALLGAAKDNALIFAVVGMILFAILATIVRTGSRTIDRQRDDLQARLAEMETLNQTNQSLNNRIKDAMMNVTRNDSKLQRRLGSDLHDGAAQLIGFLLLRLDQLDTYLRTARSKDRALAVELLADIRDSANQAMTEIRSVSEGLVAPYLESGQSLETALRAVIRMHENRTGTRVAFRYEIEDPTISETSTHTLCRIVQEALSNAFKHGEAKMQEVVVTGQDDRLTVRILDEGPGPYTENPSRKSVRLGLQGMRFRTESLDGRFSIEAREPSGTAVTCVFSTASLATEFRGN